MIEMFEIPQESIRLLFSASFLKSSVDIIVELCYKTTTRIHTVQLEEHNSYVEVVFDKK